MKAVVFFLAVLAALKLGHHEYLYRTSTRDVIVSAYRDRATEACQRDMRATSLGLPPQAWGNGASINFVVGKSNLDVYFWQVDSELWNARYRNPYLLLIAGTRSGTVFCEYDIVNAAAAVRRM